jgi:hypothetical protein
MVKLYNPLQKPSQATTNQLSVYFDEVNWASETNLLTLSVSLFADASNVTSLGLNLHYDKSKISYTPDTSYSLNPNTGTDIIGQGIDNILTNGSSTAAGHTEKNDTSDLDGSAATTAYVDAYWRTTYDAVADAMAAWPGSTDVTLYDINFTVTDTSSPITFSFSPDSNFLKEGYSLSAASQDDISIDLTLLLDDVVQNIEVKFEDVEGALQQLPDQPLIFMTNDTETTTVATAGGTLGALSQTLSFTHVELESESYNDGISLSDAILQLEHIVNLKTLSGNNAIAADVNGDGNITLSDAILTLEHIVNLSSISTCSLVDSAGSVVTELSPSTIAELTLVHSGDVNLSATFVDIA